MLGFTLRAHDPWESCHAACCPCTDLESQDNLRESPVASFADPELDAIPDSANPDRQSVGTLPVDESRPAGSARGLPSSVDALSRLEFAAVDDAGVFGARNPICPERGTLQQRWNVCSRRIPNSGKVRIICDDIGHGRGME